MQLQELLARLGGGAPSAAASEPVPEFRWNPDGAMLIGLNDMHPFGYGLSTGTWGSATYTSDPFVAGGADTVVLPDARLDVLKAAGFDFLRMAVDVGVLCAAANDTVLDTRIAEIVAGTVRRVAKGFKVIVDMHVLIEGQHPVTDWRNTDLIDGPGGPKFTRLLYVVPRLATALAAQPSLTPDKVCIELFNEPPYHGFFGGKTPWAEQIPVYWSAVRAVCDYTLVVGGTDLNSVDGLLSGSGTAAGLIALNPANFDANTGYSFHSYESGVFTHQRITGTIFEDMKNLTFPASDYPGGLSQAKADFTAEATAKGHASNIEAVVTNTGWASSLDTYFNQLGSKAHLAVRLAVATAWADSNGVTRKQLMDTEFGVAFAGAEDASETSAANFITAIREISQEAGIGCITIHEMQGSDFGIQSSTNPWTLNSAVIGALFPG